MKKILLLLLSSVLLYSCAKSYSGATVNGGYNFESKQNVELSINSDLEGLRNNKTYSKGLADVNVSILKIKISNTTNEKLVFGENLFLYSGDSKVNLMEGDLVYQRIRQSTMGYLFYLLLTPLQFVSGSSSIPIGVVIGPGIAIGNMLVASKANTNLENEIVHNNLYHQIIKPGETKEGYICVSGNLFANLHLQIENQ